MKFAISLFFLLATLFQFGAAASSSICQDDPKFRHERNDLWDCNWIADNDGCGLSTDNGNVIGHRYCPLRCGRCDRDVTGTVATKCTHLNVAGRCEDNPESVAYFVNFPSLTIDEMLSDVPLSQYFCYVERYPNLKHEYCQDDVANCNIRGLSEHYNNFGKQRQLIFGCRTRKTTPAVPLTNHLVPYTQANKDDEARPAITLLLFETDEKKASAETVPFKQSEAAGIKSMVFGAGFNFDGFGSKWVLATSVLRTMPPNALVFIGDGRDVLLNIDGLDNTRGAKVLSAITEAYRAITSENPKAVIMSAEAQCCVAALTHAQPGDYFDENSRRSGRACSSGTQDCPWAGDALRLPWEAVQEDLAKKRTGLDVADAYLNAGLVGGTVENLLNVLEIANIDGSEDDQAVFTDLMYRRPDLIVLDYAQEIFGNARWILPMEAGGCPFDQDTSNGRGLVHHETKTTPLFLHTPGKFFECYDWMAEKLHIEVEKHTQRELQSALGPTAAPTASPSVSPTALEASPLPSVRLDLSSATRVRRRMVQGIDISAVIKALEYGMQALIGDAVVQMFQESVEGTIYTLGGTVTFGGKVPCKKDLLERNQAIKRAQRKIFKNPDSVQEVFEMFGVTGVTVNAVERVLP